MTKTDDIVTRIQEALYSSIPDRYELAIRKKTDAQLYQLIGELDFAFAVGGITEKFYDDESKKAFLMICVILGELYEAGK